MMVVVVGVSWWQASPTDSGIPWANVSVYFAVFSPPAAAAMEYFHPYTHINSKCPTGLEELSDIILLLCPPVVTPWGPLFSSSEHTHTEAV